MSFATGSLVQARGREWVVLPESTEDLLILRPLGGSADETAGIYLPLEEVRPASFDLPSPEFLGNHLSCRMLRDAVRLGVRNSAGPFRSFGRIAVEPRPYQLVPLLVALKQETVRILIADDVGIGKTVEGALIARELLDRGDAQRLAVLCSPQLAEQWQRELKEKFHLDAELVLSSTASRLERGCRPGQSLFELYPFVVVSTDFIKSDQRRHEFTLQCPELVIVDEAHTCVGTDEGKGSRHQRYRLIRDLAGNPDRHLILLTATPHSGKDDAFRTLIGLLKPEFKDLPDNLAGKENEGARRSLAEHFVQRIRADIRHFMKTDTPFPEREEREDSYQLSREYKEFFDTVLKYARESVQDPEGGQFHQRVRWWSALALLRSIASSPAAAAETLRKRAPHEASLEAGEIEEIGPRTVLDLEDDDLTERLDMVPGADTSEDGTAGQPNTRQRFLELARIAEGLKGEKDQKLKQATGLIKELLTDGFNPIVFCRFIPTADYVAEELRKVLPRNVEISCITGILPPSEREERIRALTPGRKVMVCTDCLSEGINLQEHFDAVFHYDLSWNPTRHEQRVGRVDRFGQAKPKIRVVTYYGVDTRIDGIMLEILLRKHKRIQTALGISIPMPVDSRQIIEAIFEGLLLREGSGSGGKMLPGFEEFITPTRERLHREWDNASEREKRSRTMFAQESIRFEEVEQEFREVQAAVGSGADVRRFVHDAVQTHQGRISGADTVEIDLSESPAVLRDLLGDPKKLQGKFDLPVGEGVEYFSRTHPLVQGLADYVMQTALDPVLEGQARRCGVIRTRDVSIRTTLLLVRSRFQILATRAGREHQMLAEDCLLMAFTGSPQEAVWLSPMEAEKLLGARPGDNTPPDLARPQVQRILDGIADLRPHLEQAVGERAGEILESHWRVRRAVRMRKVSHRVVPQLPPDLLGLFVFLPLA